MVVIEVKKEDKEKVFEILINNRLFRALSENRFDIVDNKDGVFEKLANKKIKFKVIERE